MKGLEYSPGEIIRGKYQIKELVGSGTFSKVYKVWDYEAKEDRALHIFMPVEGGGFSKSAPVVFELIKEMNHPGIPKQFEWFQEENFYGSVEEYIIGTNLETLAKNRFSRGEKFRFEETLPIMEGIIDVLIYAHRYMPHCYLKPHHIFVLPKGKVVVTDFGIPYIYSVEVFTSKLIAEGESYYYIPPEFISKKGMVSRSADVYSIGILLYELLTGIIPKKEKLPPSTFNPSLDKDIDRFILKCIDDDPKKRFGDIIELKREYFYLLDKEYEKEDKYESPFILFDLIAHEEKEVKVEEKTVIEELFEEEKVEEEVKREEVKVEPEGRRRTNWILPAIASVFFIVVGAIGAYVMTHRKLHPKTSVEIVIKESEEEKGVISEGGTAVEERSEEPKIEEPQGKEVVKEEKVEVSHKKEEKEKPPQKEPSSENKEKEKIVVPPKRQQPLEKKKCPDDMVYIPAGSFIMGSSSDDPMRNIGEVEAKRVYVEEFCIDRYEFPNRKGEKPWINVTYMDAQEECRKVGKRLCKEEEWEKACKGPENFKYPYGNVWNPDACVTETKGGTDRTLKPSGSALSCVSGYGVYDMSGNVKEWVSALFMEGLPDRVLKGGSFARPDYATRCATRDALPPETRDPEVGFRCCKDVEK